MNKLAFLFVLLGAVALCSCAYNETNNTYTANGNDNRFDTSQTSSTSKPVDVRTDMAGSGYGSVQK